MLNSLNAQTAKKTRDYIYAINKQVQPQQQIKLKINIRKRIFNRKWIWQLPKVHTTRNGGSRQEVGQHCAGQKVRLWRQKTRTKIN